MANEKFTQLPTVTSALTSDIICAVQGGVSVQETLSQILALGLDFNVLNNAGNPNGVVAGSVNQFCYDTTNQNFYICTVAGTTLTTVWTLIGANVIDPGQGGSGVANPAIYSLPVAQGSSPFAFVGPLLDGQVLIGSSSSNPVAANITAGTNITISNAPGGITISAPGAASFVWNVVTGTSSAITVNNGYITNNAALVTLTLPTVAAVGTVFSVLGQGAGGWQIAQNIGQNIRVGSVSSTSGVSGYIASTNFSNGIHLVCISANTTWANAYGPQGIITIV